MDFPDKNTGVGCHFLLQRIFPVQRLNLPLLHWYVGSLPLSHQGSSHDVLLSFWWSCYCFLFNFLFSWPCQAACGILVPWPGIKLSPPALEAESLNYWTTKEVPLNDIVKLKLWQLLMNTIQSSSVQSLSCVRLYDPMNRSTPGLPVHHQLPEFTQTVHWVGDAIQPSHPLSSPSPPALNLSQHQGLFKWVFTSKKLNLKQEMRVVVSILIPRFENNMFIIFIHKQLWFVKKEIKKFFFCFMSIIFLRWLLSI